MVWRGASSAKDNEVVSMMQQVADIIGSISTNDVAFIFAVIMNFILLFGLYLTNGISMVLADMARTLE